MRLASMSRGLRLASLATGLAALVAFSVGGSAGSVGPSVKSASGGGSFRLSVGQGGALSGELGLSEKGPSYLLQAAMTEFEADGENPGLVSGRIEGYLLDAASLDLIGSFDGPFAIQGDMGRFVAEVHPLEGPDPWKVDAGTLKGWMRVSGARSSAELSTAQLHGNVLLGLELAMEL